MEKEALLHGLQNMSKTDMEWINSQLVGELIIAVYPENIVKLSASDPVSPPTGPKP